MVAEKHTKEYKECVRHEIEEPCPEIRVSCQLIQLSHKKSGMVGNKKGCILRHSAKMH